MRGSDFRERQLIGLSTKTLRSVAPSSTWAASYLRPSSAAFITTIAESSFHISTHNLNRRIPNKQILIEEIAAWEQDRNANHTKADWQFTTKNARIKLKHLYPAI